MNRWGKIVLVLATVATAAWLVSGWLGRSVIDDATLARHTLIAFSALLALLLTHGWIVAYLLLLRRYLGAAVSLEPKDRRELDRGRAIGVGSAGAAVVSALLLFTVSNALYPARLKAGPHTWAAIVCSVVLVAALVVEGRALVSAGRVCRRLDR